MSNGKSIKQLVHGMLDIRNSVLHPSVEDNAGERFRSGFASLVVHHPHSTVGKEARCDRGGSTPLGSFERQSTCSRTLVLLQ